jgi:hypothetical protein
MFARCAWPLLFFPAVLLAQPTASSLNEPKDATGWFVQASERMTLRMPGATPFHLHADFQANPGRELLGPSQKSSIITGHGTYDEVWIEPHEWRREVTLGEYHAIEIEANGTRKMQASSDYEPSRVVMLLDALITPIPRYFTSKDFHGGSGWKIDHVAAAGGLSLVRLSKSMGSQRADYTDSFYFLPNSGALAMSNRQGFVSIWSSHATFDGKVVPREFTIKAGDMDLLNARISIQPAGDVDDARFAMDGPAAEPGMTLRPLRASDVRMPESSGSFSYISNELGPAPVFSMIGTLDRHGRFREMEILLAPNPKDVAIIMNHFREERHKPATIDGTLCQIQMFWLQM